MSKRQKVIYRLLVLLWLMSVYSFFSWWFEPKHITDLVRFTFNSMLIIWTLLLTGYFFYFAGRMKKSSPRIELPKDLKIAMVVTKVPSEPFEIVKTTLTAMLLQKYPHDTWLADEDPDAETIKWCKANGVNISTRKDNPDYHREEWPRRKKCKEGNLAYFYDHYGYANYEFVIQLDADHVPSVNYLEEMIKPFADPKVGYVSAPSICSANAHDSWAARGRLHLEAFLHGVQQAGHTNGFAPLCIGSHYAVRTSALNEIGGIGPELAEDHSTTFLMQANGWKGVHALDAIAYGDGPKTFSDAMTQEFQWSKSLAILLMTLTPKHLRKLSFKLKFQFLFSQMWYLLFGLVFLSVHLMPFIALLTGKAWVNVNFIEFILRYNLITLLSISIVYYLKSNKWTRPIDTKILSWEGFVFQFARWPYVLLAFISAFITVVKRKQFVFKITPKGSGGVRVIPISTFLPYLILIFLSIFSAFLGHVSSNVLGYYYFVIINSLIYFLVIIVATTKHVTEQIKND